MAKCGNCGAEARRIRSRWKGNQQLPDECPSCAPQSFEKFTNPSDKKIWMGYEAHPNEYVQGVDGGFDRKPEYRLEQEQKLAQLPEDERLAQEQAVAEKRATRRTLAMAPDETQAALAKARLLAAAMEESARLAQKETDEAELQSWIQKASQA